MNNISAQAGVSSLTDTAVARTNFRWAILAFAYLTYIVAGADRANLAVAIPYMRGELELSNADIGLAAGLFFIGMLIIQLPGSLILQKTVVRLALGAAIFLTSVVTLAVSYVSSAPQLMVNRLLLGVTEGLIPIGCLTMINRWFPHQERGTAVGIFVSSIKLAPAVTPPICAAIIYLFGWRSIFFWFAVPGILIAALWVFLAKDKPRESKFVNAAEAEYIDAETADPREKSRTRVRDWPRLDYLLRTRFIAPIEKNSEILKSPLVWGCAIGYGMLSGLTYSIMTWVPTYLVEVKKYSLMQMGFVSSAPWVGAVLGAVAGGLISDRVFGGRRKPLMMLSAGSSIVTMYGLTVSPNEPMVLALMLMLTGMLLNMGYSTFLAYPMGFVTRSGTPFALALVNMGGATCAGSAPFAMGLILDKYDWNVAFTFLAICSLVSLVIVILLFEQRRGRADPVADSSGVPESSAAR